MRSPFLAWITFACLVIFLLAAPAPLARGQSQSQSAPPGPMAQVAREYAWRPIRADVLPMAQGVKAGEPIPVKVVLLDGSGKLTNAIENTTLVVQAAGPSQTPVTVNVGIATGASAADLLLPGMAPGLVKLTVKQPGNRVLESSNFVIIAPALPAKTNTKIQQKSPKKTVVDDPTSRLDGVDRLSASLRNKKNMSVVEFQTDLPDSGPQVMLQVSGERDTNVRADGISYERIAVYYMDAEPAAFPIQVWLAWDHGDIKPNPLIIKRGELFAEAHWTSGSPVANAKVSIADIKPRVAVAGSSQATINFVEPVSGVAFFNPPDTLSVADAYSLHARFYDLAGNFVKTADKREVTVSTNNPIVQFKPDTRDADWDFETTLVPAGWGKAEIEVATPGYPPFKHTVVITYLSVLWLCLVGGLVGTLVDVLSHRPRPRGWRIPARFVVGVLAGLLACWLYIVVGVPGVPPALTHNRIAIPGVSLLAGWAGIVVFRKAGRSLGMEV